MAYYYSHLAISIYISSISANNLNQTVLLYSSRGILDILFHPFTVSCSRKCVFKIYVARFCTKKLVWGLSQHTLKNQRISIKILKENISQKSSDKSRITILLQQFFFSNSSPHKIYIRLASRTETEYRQEGKGGAGTSLTQKC